MRAGLLVVRAVKQSATFFFGFMLIGVFTGSLFGHLSGQLKVEGQHSGLIQENIMIALVDDAQAERAELLGLWLAVHNNQDIYWMPIYPQPLSNNESTYSKAHTAITIDLAESIGWEMLAPLRQAGVDWGHMILLDSESIAVMSAAGQIEVNLDAPPSWQEPQGALAAQVMAIQAWCEQIPNVKALDLFLEFSNQQTILRSDLGQFEAISLWDQFWGKDANLSCHHLWVE